MEFTHEEMLQLLAELQVDGDAAKLIAEERYRNYIVCSEPVAVVFWRPFTKVRKSWISWII